MGGSADRRRARADRRGAGRRRHVQPRGCRRGSAACSTSRADSTTASPRRSCWWRSPGSPRTKASPGSRARAELRSRCWSGRWPAPRSAGSAASSPDWPAPGLALGGARRSRGPGPGAARLHRRPAGRRQRLRRRVRRRPGLRRGRRPRRREGGLLRGAVGRRGLDDQLADLRRPGRADDRRLVDLEHAGLRRPQPHRGPDAAGGARPGSAPASTGSVSRSSAGSAPAASPRSSSRCWPSRTCTTRGRATSSRSSPSPSCSASSRTASAPGRSRTGSRNRRRQPRASPNPDVRMCSPSRPDSNRSTTRGGRSDLGMQRHQGDQHPVVVSNLRSAPLLQYISCHFRESFVSCPFYSVTRIHRTVCGVWLRRTPLRRAASPKTGMGPSSERTTLGACPTRAQLVPCSAARVPPGGVGTAPCPRFGRGRSGDDPDNEDTPEQIRHGLQRLHPSPPLSVFTWSGWSRCGTSA